MCTPSEGWRNGFITGKPGEGRIDRTDAGRRGSVHSGPQETPWNRPPQGDQGEAEQGEPDHQLHRRAPTHAQDHRRGGDEVRGGARLHGATATRPGPAQRDLRRAPPVREVLPATQHPPHRRPPHHRRGGDDHPGVVDPQRIRRPQGQAAGLGTPRAAPPEAQRRRQGRGRQGPAGHDQDRPRPPGPGLRPQVADRCGPHRRHQDRQGGQTPRGHRGIITAPQRQALARLRFNSAETPDDVWQTSPSHVDGLDTRAVHRVQAGILDAKESSGHSPIGLALQGQKGVGKTHLLGGVRRAVQLEDGYFFLIDLTTGAAFWEDVAEAMRRELLRTNDDGEFQLTKLLRRLCDKANVPATVDGAVLGGRSLTVEDLHKFVGALRGVDVQVAVECGDTIWSFEVSAATENVKMNIGRDYLAGLPEATPGERQAWGIHPRPKSFRTLVTEISRVLALTGPSVVAIDQLDTLVAKANSRMEETVTDAALVGELAVIADGLLQLRETTRRTLSIVACLPNTWTMLHSVSSDTVGDRFTETPILGAINDPGLARELVAKWLGVTYQTIGFTPPHPTWPVASSAFGESWIPYTPRQLLRRLQEHAEVCLHGEIRELTSFDEEIVVEAPQQVGPEPEYFAEFDRRFKELCERADVEAALNQHTEDTVMPDLLHAALRSWITEIGNDDRSWETEPPPDGGRRLHAGLRRTLDEERDLAERWMFRAIAGRHGNTVLRLVREAKEAAGIRNGVRNRHLVLLHHGGKGWTGAKTRAEVSELAQVGSPRLEISRDDVRTFWALKEMLSNQTYELLNWLVVRKPASHTTFLREILPIPAQTGADHQETRPPPARGTTQPPAQSTTQRPADGPSPQPSPAAGTSSQPPKPGEILLGMDNEIRIELESLRKHAVIFAGSGTGKTVLLRRIIEECALQGVSAIVLDPNNDLARMGDAWPRPPDGWRPGDADR